MENRRFPAERDRRVVQGYMVWWNNRTFVPPTDVIEFPDRLMVLVEIAGMRSGDFNVSLANRTLVISGTRERPSLGQAAYHQVEIAYGEFRVEVQLPYAVVREEVSASYRDGVLQVSLPRHAESQHVLIPVTRMDEENNE